MDSRGFVSHTQLRSRRIFHKIQRIVFAASLAAVVVFMYKQYWDPKIREIRANVFAAAKSNELISRFYYITATYPALFSTLADLQAIRGALEKYKAKNGEYPKVEGSVNDKSRRADWIPGLSAEYIKAIPFYSRGYRSSIKGYQYFSDGYSYKIIMHDPFQCVLIKSVYPEVIDPRRDCWAYGYWSAGAEEL